jgi:hypothetical protein
VPLTSPFLVVRPGEAFWVESCQPDDCSATLQAFRDGSFTGAWCYDATGGEWPIRDACLKRRPSLFDRAFPWKRVPVKLRVGPRAEIDLSTVIARIADVLRSGNAFCEDLRTPPSQILRQFERVRTPADVIDLARRYA